MCLITILPEWAREVISSVHWRSRPGWASPFGGDPQMQSLFASFESRIYPILIAFGVLAPGLWLHRRRSARFPAFV
jgi:hypothetical protein